MRARYMALPLKMSNKQVQITHLGDHVDRAVSLGGIHCDWEVIGSIGRNGDVLRIYAENLHDEQLGWLVRRP